MTKSEENIIIVYSFCILPLCLGCNFHQLPNSFILIVGDYQSGRKGSVTVLPFLHCVLST
jgi:hypothetical protein